MNIAYTEEEFNRAKSMDKLKLVCKGCKTVFLRNKHSIMAVLHGHKAKTNEFCTNLCGINFRKKRCFVNCSNCFLLIEKNPTDISKSKSGRSFCGSSCAATYNNTHKTTGTRRSKLEKWIEERLTTLYPDLEIHFNKKETINSELDIYFSSLNLAFELNGIFHYEPIYGEEQLSKIQNNDNRKFQACLEKGIELCIIDSSKQTYFKSSISQKYLDIIVDLVSSKLSD